MLKGISPKLSPELLADLHRMGHGDTLVLADAHFPGHTVGRKVVRADGLAVAELLDAILPLFELDSYVDAPMIMMAVVEGDVLDPAVEADYRGVLDRHLPRSPAIARIERHEFYEAARSASVIVMTGEVRKYGNLLVRKGVTPS